MKCRTGRRRRRELIVYEKIWVQLNNLTPVFLSSVLHFDSGKNEENTTENTRQIGKFMTFLNKRNVIVNDFSGLVIDI